MTIEKRDEQRFPASPEIWLPFYGGLGDVILRSYETRFWHFLEGADQRVAVVVCSVNPFTSELFRWHANRSRIVLYELSHLFDDFSRRGLSGKDFHEAIANFAGLTWPFDWGHYKVPPPGDWKPTFHAPDYLDDSGHIVFHPFAGLKHRSLSRDSLRTSIRFLGEMPCTVYVPSRDFVRFHAGRAGHGAESLPDMALPDNFVVLKNLSVPATLNLIRNAMGFVGTHSSLVLAAAKEGVPSLVLYPESFESRFEAAVNYESYVKLEHMTALPMGAVTDSSLREWFSRTFDSEKFVDGRSGHSRVDRLARWALSRGGKINIDWHRPPDFMEKTEQKEWRNREIGSVDELPLGRYRIWRLNFGGLDDFGDSELAELRELGTGIETITHLNLANTSITSTGIDSLRWLSDSLKRIRITGESQSRDIAKRLASVLPDTMLA